MKGDSFGRFTIPADQLVVYVNEREGDDFTGISILRSAYKPWFIKAQVERVAGVGVERHGVGIPTFYVPASLRDDDAMMDRIEAIARDLRAGEFSYVVMPGPKGDVTSGNPEGGFLFEIVSPQGSLPQLVDFLEYLRGDIKGNVLARFSELGHGSVGARATGESQSPVWIDALHTVASYVSDVNQIAIRRLVDMNYTVGRYPRLVAQDIESKDLEEFANAHSKLTAGGAILPDRSYRQFVRRTLGAPDEDEDADEQTRPRPSDADEDGPWFEPDKPDGGEPPEDPPRARHMPASNGHGPAPRYVRETFDLAPLVDAVRAALTEQPAPVVNVVVDVAPLVDAVRELAAREQPAPQVDVTVEAPTVNVPPAQITVNVPDQPAPVVNVAPAQVTVEAPAQEGRRPVRRVELERGRDGRIDGATVRDVNP
jgi:hypothetical protein